MVVGSGLCGRRCLVAWLEKNFLGLKKLFFDWVCMGWWEGWRWRDDGARVVRLEPNMDYGKKTLVGNGEGRSTIRGGPQLEMELKGGPWVVGGKLRSSTRGKSGYCMETWCAGGMKGFVVGEGKRCKVDNRESWDEKVEILENREARYSHENEVE